MKNNRIFYGPAAVAAVEKKLGRKLNLAEKRIVEEEGFAEGSYKDTKGIVTVGVGQTGKFAKMPLDQVFRTFESEAARMIKGYAKLPESVRAELVQAAYRGDIQQSPTFRKLFNEGKYVEAAQEFLNNKEYKTTKSAGLKSRFEKVAEAVKSLENRRTAYVPTEDVFGTPGDLRPMQFASADMGTMSDVPQPGYGQVPAPIGKAVQDEEMDALERDFRNRAAQARGEQPRFQNLDYNSGNPLQGIFDWMIRK